MKPFGSFDGKRVDQFTLVSTTGVEIDIINWGVTVRDWRVPVGEGLRSVVLGFERFDDYPAHSPFFGSLAGRVANRLAGASFELDGRLYTLEADASGNMLHGGSETIGRLVWEARPDDATNAVVFSHVSPDGAMGFPGEVRMKATYRLDGNRLRLELGATTDRPTILSLVQHQYFNLGTDDHVLDHSYWLAAGAYTETSPGDLIPTGNILEARPGSDQYFRVPRKMRDAAGRPLDYDGNFVLDSGRNLAEPMAIVTSPTGDLTLRQWTDRPGVQFYNAVTTAVPVPGLGGRHYGPHAGFCLEDQAFPDAPHHPHFPSIVITPERPYAPWCEFEIA
jgi:aldose 1-epimerase